VCADPVERTHIGVSKKLSQIFPLYQLKGSVCHKLLFSELTLLTLGFFPFLDRSVNCSTKIGAKFINLVDTCFPPNNPLQKIFNRNTLKFSYICMLNMAKTISKHNSKVIKQNKNRVSYWCNCKKVGASCPLNGACLTKGVVYEAKVTKTSDQSTETYTGLT
jgi:hypothetical protein